MQKFVMPLVALALGFSGTALAAKVTLTFRVPVAIKNVDAKWVKMQVSCGMESKEGGSRGVQELLPLPLTNGSLTGYGITTLTFASEQDKSLKVGTPYRCTLYLGNGTNGWLPATNNDGTGVFEYQGTLKAK